MSGSGYHYHEGANCNACYQGQTYDYSNAGYNTGGDACLPDCMNRFSKERSTRDQIDYQIYVLGEHVNPFPFNLNKPAQNGRNQRENFRRK